MTTRPVLFWILIGLVLGLIVFGWTLIIQEKLACDRRGGILMRTLWSYECVAIERR